MYGGEPPDVIASDLTIRILPGNRIGAPFLTAYLSYLYLTGYWQKRAGGASGSMKKITREQIKALRVPVPSLAEQQRIAAVLQDQMAAVERARAAAEARLEAANALPAAYFRAAFDQPEAIQWSAEPLGKYAEIVGGVQKSPDRAPAVHHRPYLTVRNVQRGYLDLAKVDHFEVTSEELERLRLQSGDVLVVEGNGSIDQIGRNAVFVEDGEEWIHQNHVIRVRLPRDVWLYEFVSMYLNSEEGRSQMIRKAQTTSGLYTLSVGKVATLEVPCPPISAQMKLVAELSRGMQIQKAVFSALREESRAISSLPAALLRRAFSGEM
jgi:type I restriction enzyme S subunit